VRRRAYGAAAGKLARRGCGKGAGDCAGGSNFADNGTLTTVANPTIGLNDVFGDGKVTIRYVRE
jgi:hypothetical protein